MRQGTDRAIGALRERADRLRMVVDDVLGLLGARVDVIGGFASGRLVGRIGCLVDSTLDCILVGADGVLCLVNHVSETQCPLLVISTGGWYRIRDR